MISFWHRQRQRIVAVGAVLMVGTGIIGTRALRSAEEQLAQGQQHTARGDSALAISSFSRAARWWFPGNSHAAEALGNLEVLARTAEAQNRPLEALAAWRSVRGAVMSTRHWGVRREAMSEANAAITRLHSGPNGPEPQRGPSLEVEHRPAMAFAPVVAGGFLLWFFGMFAFAGSAFDDHARVRVGSAVRGGILALGGVVLLGVGLWFA